jgi:carbamoylphosphate synthase small subunit
MKKYLLIALTVCSFYACTKNTETTEGHDHHEAGSPLNDKTQEVLAIHDSIMPNMDKLMELKKQLKMEVKITDSLMAVKPVSTLKTYKNEALKIAAELDSADHAMMGWMHGFKMDSLKKLDKSGADVYLADQKKKIEEVRKLMNTSITDASAFIEKNKNK